MRGLFRLRSEREKRRSATKPMAYFSVIDPGLSNLRLLVVEAAQGQASVWGWAERSDWMGEGAGALDWLDACQSVAARAEEMAQDRAGRWLLPDHMVVGLPASQLRGRAWSITHQRPRPEQPVEERELRGLLGRALRLAVNRLLGSEVEAAEAAEPGWLLVEAVPVTLSIDGRGVTDPVGFRGRELGATVFAALARTEVVAGWQAVAERLEFSMLTLTAAPLALAAAQQGAPGILVDVGAQSTDLTWWRNGQPLILDSFPVGGRALTGALEEKWGLTSEKAERLKRAYTEGRLEEEAREQVLDVLAPVLQVWFEGAEAAFARMYADWESPLPHRLQLLGGGSMLPEVAESAAVLAYSERLRFARYPKVKRFQPTDVVGVVNRTQLGRSAGDSAALALAAWVARENRPPDRPTRILRELCTG